MLAIWISQKSICLDLRQCKKKLVGNVEVDDVGLSVQVIGHRLSPTQCFALSPLPTCHCLLPFQLFLRLRPLSLLPFPHFPSDNQCDCFRYFHLHPWLTTIPHFYTRAPLIAFPTFNTFLMNFFLSHCLLPWGRPSFYFLFHLFLSPAWCSMIRNQISKELMMDRFLNLWSKKRWNRLWIIDQILEWTDKQRNHTIKRSLSRKWQIIEEKSFRM